MAGFGWLWFDQLGAPMAGISAEHAESMVATEIVQSLDDLRTLLDRYDEYPPDPPWPISTIDELSYSIPTRVSTDEVYQLLREILSGEPDGRAELLSIIEDARRDLVG